MQHGLNHLAHHQLKQLHDFLDSISGFDQRTQATMHFLLHCPDYHCARHIVFDKTKSIDSNISQQIKMLLTKYFLIGANMIKPNTFLVAEFDFNQSTERFNHPPNFFKSKSWDQMLSFIE